MRKRIIMAMTMGLLMAGSAAAQVIDPDMPRDRLMAAPEPSIHYDVTLPFSIAGKNSFSFLSMVKFYYGYDSEEYGYDLPVDTKVGRIFYLPEKKALFFLEVNVAYDGDTPFIENPAGNDLKVYFSGTNWLKAKGNVFESHGKLTLQGTKNTAIDMNRLTLVSGDTCISMKDGQLLNIEHLPLTLEGSKCGIKMEEATREN